MHNWFRHRKPLVCLPPRFMSSRGSAVMASGLKAFEWKHCAQTIRRGNRKNTTLTLSYISISSPFGLARIATDACANQNLPTCQKYDKRYDPSQRNHYRWYASVIQPGRNSLEEQRQKKKRGAVKRKKKRGSDSGVSSGQKSDISASDNRKDLAGDNLVDNDGGSDEAKSDSVYKILMGRERPDPSEEKFFPPLPRTFGGWKRVFVGTWTMYRDTWPKKKDKDILEDSTNKKGKEDGSGYSIDSIDVSGFQEQRDQIRKQTVDNLGQNLNTLHQEGSNFIESAKEQTGIRNKEDLRKWASDQMKLATECLTEFMAGYRAGRDEEIDNMLHKYFKELDDSGINDNSDSAGKHDATNSDQSESAQKGSRRRRHKRHPNSTRFRL